MLHKAEEKNPPKGEAAKKTSNDYEGKTLPAATVVARKNNAGNKNNSQQQNNNAATRRSLNDAQGLTGFALMKQQFKQNVLRNRSFGEELSSELHDLASRIKSADRARLERNERALQENYKRRQALKYQGPSMNAKTNARIQQEQKRYIKK